MKLEIKHIAPYLPYGLKVDLLYSEYHEAQTGVELYRIETGKTKSTNWKVDPYVIVGDIECEINYIKPLLHPLSKLTEEIEHNGETIVPLVVISEIIGYSIYECAQGYWGWGDNDQGYEVEITKDLNFVVWYDEIGEKIYRKEPISHECITKLLELHFDIYGLLDNGLAKQK